jgi:hypothetical protein
LIAVLSFLPTTAGAEDRVEWIRSSVESISIREQPAIVTIQARLVNRPELVVETIDLFRFGDALRANIAETLPLALITEQGENGSSA